MYFRLFLDPKNINQYSFGGFLSQKQAVLLESNQQFDNKHVAKKQKKGGTRHKKRLKQKTQNLNKLKLSNKTRKHKRKPKYTRKFLH